MFSLPSMLHSVAQVRQIDRHAIDVLGIPGYALMTRAGAAALDALRAGWPEAARVVVACGAGNNAGDGYVLARLARQAGLDVTVVALADPALLKADALTAYRDFAAAGGAVGRRLDAALAAADVIVDALFGTGLARDLDAEWCHAIALLNACGRPVLSLDVPSGLDADTGLVRGEAVRATRTLTLVGLKIGLYVGAGPDRAGKILFDDLGIGMDGAAAVGCVARRLEPSLLGALLPPRRRTANKGDFGHVLVVAGGPGMAGAARLAGEACLRSGAGRVTVATRAANVAAIVAGRPELMTRAVEGAADLEAMLGRVDLIAIGPGLGQDDWARAMWATALAADKPMVVDADALNLLATSPVRRDDWILTPHPGEAGRLLGTTSSVVQSDRMAAARSLAERYGGIAVLKGACTVVSRAGLEPRICDTGNPGMASPGMGDVLTGIIAALAVQGPDLWSAACAGVLVHGMAGDVAAREGERGLLASDLFVPLRAAVNPGR